MPAPALSERDLTVLRSFAQRINPSDAGAHNNLGVLYYQKGLIDEAIAEFARALELDSKMQVAQTNLEIAYRDSGHYERRIADWLGRAAMRADWERLLGAMDPLAYDQFLRFVMPFFGIALAISLAFVVIGATIS